MWVKVFIILVRQVGFLCAALLVQFKADVIDIQFTFAHIPNEYVYYVIVIQVFGYFSKKVCAGTLARFLFFLI